MKKKVKTVALIGASDRKEKYGNIILRNLVKKGYRVYPVNPVSEKIEGLKVFNNTDDLPEDVDLYIFVVPWKAGLSTVTKLIREGKNNFWFQPGAEHPSIKTIMEGKKDLKYSFNKCIMVESDIAGDIEF